jgi:hypothetical protein
MPINKPLKTTKTRRLFVIDLENAACSSRPNFAMADYFATKIVSILKIEVSDLVVVAGACGNALMVNHVASRLHGQARYRNGKDGADIALLQHLEQTVAQTSKSTETSISEVIIVSGDHIFEKAVKDLRQKGIFTTVVAYRKTLSRSLANVCNRIIYLDLNEVNEQAA